MKSAFFKKSVALLLTVALLFAFTGCVDEANTGSSVAESGFGANSNLVSSGSDSANTVSSVKPNGGNSTESVDINNLPKYSGKDYIAINNNIPKFSKDELTTKSYEFYSELDALGRCGVTIASVGRDIMPTEDRGSIGQVKPTGWHTVKYDIVDGKYLYNRCHLIGFQLTGENANTHNLITGTRYLNVDIMLPFENLVADYVKETGNHVAYRVTPIFEGNNLVATGVQMEGYSIEDDGDGVCFNVFCYNIQPGISINYANGESKLSGEQPKPSESKAPAVSSKAPTVSSKAPASSKNDSNTITYVLNTNTKKFHFESCSYVKSIKAENRGTSNNRSDIINNGYQPCKVCNP